MFQKQDYKTTVSYFLNTFFFLDLNLFIYLFFYYLKAVYFISIGKITMHKILWHLTNKLDASFSSFFLFFVFFLILFYF